MTELRPPKIAIIGGGFGGICAGIQLQKQLGITNFTIFDENKTFGGTWLTNTYPNCACDVQSFMYSFSFELNPNWSKNYPCQKEIHDYILRVANKYGLFEKAKFSTQVKRSEWDEENSQWNLWILDKNSHKEQQLQFDFVITAVGRLRVPFIPEEFAKFQGPMIHSSKWDDTIDLQNKSVALIGSGASAIQILPGIAPLVKKLHSYQRRPAWVSPRNQFEFGFMKNIFKNFPIFMWIFRCLIFLFNEFHFNLFCVNSIVNRIGTFKLTRFRDSHFQNSPELKSKLKPNYKLGCKRILLSNEYYDAFNLPQVELHREAIKKVEGYRIMTEDGRSQEIDVLILATGFRVQEFYSPMKIIGKDKTELLEAWESVGLRSYFGIMSSLAPNLFFVAGPNSALGHNSAIFMIECQVQFALQVLKETIRRGSKCVVVKDEIESGWMAGVQKAMKKTIWGTESCGSWYVNSSTGVVTALWPKSALSYYWDTKYVDFANMEFKS